jgi:hypothetical protein
MFHVGGNGSVSFCIYAEEEDLVEQKLPVYIICQLSGSSPLLIRPYLQLHIKAMIFD